MDGYVVVATHHKTGTVWMETVFKRIARKLQIPFVRTHHSSGIQPNKLQPPAILFDNHARFNGCEWLLDHPKSRIVHLIRDPRDVIISAANYHRTSSEAWLHRARKDLAGLSYQQKMNSLPDDTQRYLFEMDHTSKREIHAMQAWNYDRANAVELKYEDLVEDVAGIRFRRAAIRLGFKGHEAAVCRTVFRSNSLASNPNLRKRAHVRSGDARQWRSVFNGALARAFVARFNTVLIDLGYEPDHAWIEGLPENLHAVSVTAR